MGVSHVDLIDRWPSLRAFADDLGVPYNTAKHIRRRGIIPARYWLRSVEAAKDRSIPDVTLSAMAEAAASPQPTPEPAEAAA